MRILLADDHTILREALRRNLEELGVDVVGEASDGPSAVSLALELRPDVVLMDVTMPGGDGISATRSIMRAAGRDRLTNRRMIGMHRQDDHRLAAGAVGYIDKSCSVDEVVDLARRVASGDVSLSPAVASAMRADIDTDHGHDLSEREIEVLDAVAAGCSTAEVAARLFISQKTVKNHLASIYAKLDARDRTEAVIRAVKLGIVRLV